MAPVRKRGSKRTKLMSQLNLGDLVLAKVKGFPAWPAKICRPEDWNLPPDPKKYFVEFFGTKEIAFVAPTEIQEFTTELKNKLSAKCEGKALKPFSLAVKDISEAFEQLGEKCSTDSRVGSVESTHIKQSYPPLKLGKGKEVISMNGIPVIAGEMEESEVYGSKSDNVKCSLHDKSDACSRNSKCTLSSVADDICKTMFTEKGNATALDEMHQSRIDTEFAPNVNSTSEVSSCRKGTDELFHGENPKVAKAKRSKRLASNGCSLVKRLVGIIRNNNVQDEMLNNNLGDDSKKADVMFEPIDACEQENYMILNNRKLSSSDIVTEKKGWFHITNGKPDGHASGASNAVEKSKCSYPAIGSTENAFVKEKMHNSLVYTSDGDKSDDRHESPDYVKTENNVDHEQSGGHYDIMTNQFLASGDDLLKNKNEEIFLDNQLQTGEGGSISIDIEDEVRTRVNGGSTGNSNVFTAVLDVSSSDVQNKQNYYSPQPHAGSIISENDDPECEQSIRTVGVSLSPDFHQTDRSGSMKASASQLNCKIETSLSEKIDMAIFSPKKSPFTAPSPATVRPQFSAAKTEVSIPCAQTEASSVFSRSLIMVSQGYSDQVTSQMNDLVFEDEKNKQTHKGNLSCITAEDALKDNIFSSGRLEGHKLAPLADSMDLETSISMKHLIAAAHAKVRQNQSTDHDSQVVQNQFDIVLEGSHSSGDTVSGGSFSAGTEAAVARDAFEGMLETLTRTKESIGRATRLAIDCAKYGIANKVVDIVAQKLECEPSFHRKVDLFFLVDSITQCSHSQKGIAGASYIHTVQSALPRLLRAAAPRGASARENRRQCLKVLRLWIERCIMPESLLRQYIDNIGTSNDDLISGAFVKRPCRNERPLDDPVREMEGMLVDEYGSNATFQFPGLFSHVFEEEDNGLSSKIDGDASPSEPVDSAALSEICESPIVDKHQCILEGVDGELEMEDACCNSKEEGCGDVSRSDMNSIDMESLQEGFPPLPLESPPRIPSPPPLSLLQPPHSADASPCLPPPPPRPLSEFSSRYTHFPSQPSAHSSQPSPFSSQPTPFPRQPLFSCQLPLIPCQSHPPPVPVSMTSYQLPAPLPQPVAPPPSCQSPLSLSQPPPQTAQSSLPPSELSHYPSILPPPPFPPSRPSVPAFVPPSEYSSYWPSRPVDSVSNPHPIHNSQQPRMGIAQIAQRPLYPTAVPHGPCTQSSHGNFHSLQHPQQFYACSCTLASHQGGLMQCMFNERGPMSSAGLNVGCQQGWWMGNERTSCPPHVHVGNVRPQMMPMGHATPAGNCWRPP